MAQTIMCSIRQNLNIKNSVFLRPCPERVEGWEGGDGVTIREPGDLPETVVPQPGGVYRNAAGEPQWCGAFRHERQFVHVGRNTCETPVVIGKFSILRLARARAGAGGRRNDHRRRQRHGPAAQSDRPVDQRDRR